MTVDTPTTRAPDAYPITDAPYSAHLDGERVVTLEGLVAKRPSVDEVKHAGILKTAVADTGERIKRNSSSKAIESALGKRPSVEELVQQGVLLPGSSPIKGPISASEALESLIARRPSSDELRSAGILKTTVADTGDKLKRNSFSKSLENALDKRPSAEDLVYRGIIDSSPKADRV